MISSFMAAFGVDTTMDKGVAAAILVLVVWAHSRWGAPVHAQ